jgi:hypothetical protein
MLIFLMLVALATPAPTTTATAPGVPASTQAAINTLLVRFGQALSARDGQAAADCIDFDDMLALTAERKLIEPIPRALRRKLAKTLAKQQAARYATLGAALNWQTTRITRTEPLPGGRLRITARHHSTLLGVAFRRRYWVRPGFFGWRIYDHEDVDLGVRITTGLAVGINAGRRDGPPPAWLPAAQRMLGLVQAFGAGQGVDVVGQLEGIDPAALPPVFAGLHGLLYAAGLFDLDRVAEALTVIEATQARLPEPMPALVLLRADCLHVLKRYPEAQQAADAFLALFPGDPEALTTRGLARIAANNVAGVADLEAALAERPLHQPAVIALLRTAPSDRDDALRALFAPLTAEDQQRIKAALMLDVVPLARLIRLMRK